MEKKFLIFRLNQQRFAIDLKFAKEIIPYTQPTPLPQAPDFFEGLIHLRGFFLPLINTKCLLGIENDKQNISKRKKVVVVSILKKIVGINTDEVEDILRVDENKILSAPSLVKNIDKGYFSGGFYLKDEILLIIDFEKIFVEQILPHNLQMKEKRF